MNRDTDDLLESIEEDLAFMLGKQREALTSDEIEEISAVKIKNISENMRSILDFIAVKIVGKSGVTFKGKIYFPYGNDINQLESRNKWVKELKEKQEDLYNIIIDYQDFRLPKEDNWIVQLCNLSVKVKHNELERPKRHDIGKVTSVDGLFSVDGNSRVHVLSMNGMGL